MASKITERRVIKQLSEFQWPQTYYRRGTTGNTTEIEEIVK